VFIEGVDVIHDGCMLGAGDLIDLVKGYMRLLVDAIIIYNAKCK